jgi:hypothetical protein
MIIFCMWLHQLNLLIKNLELEIIIHNTHQGVGNLLLLLFFFLGGAIIDQCGTSCRGQPLLMIYNLAIILNIISILI